MVYNILIRDDLDEFRKIPIQRLKKVRLNPKDRRRTNRGISNWIAQFSLYTAPNICKYLARTGNIFIELHFEQLYKFSVDLLNKYDGEVPGKFLRHILWYNRSLTRYIINKQRTKPGRWAEFHLRAQEKDYLKVCKQFVKRYN